MTARPASIIIRMEVEVEVFIVRDGVRVEKEYKRRAGENEEGQSANNDGQRSRAFIVRDCRQ